MHAATQSHRNVMREYGPIGQRKKNLPTSPQRIALAAFQQSEKSLVEMAARHEKATNAKAHAIYLHKQAVQALTANEAHLKKLQSAPVEERDEDALEKMQGAITQAKADIEAAETRIQPATDDHTRAAHALAEATQTYLTDKNTARRLWGSRFGSVSV